MNLQNDTSDYVPFILEDYLDNPVALARIKAHITQEALAKVMNVSQAYISKLEIQDTVPAKTLEKVYNTLKKLQQRKSNERE